MFDDEKLKTLLKNWKKMKTQTQYIYMLNNIFIMCADSFSVSVYVSFLSVCVENGSNVQLSSLNVSVTVRLYICLTLFYSAPDK